MGGLEVADSSSSRLRRLSSLPVLVAGWRVDEYTILAPSSLIWPRGEVHKQDPESANDSEVSFRKAGKTKHALNSTSGDVAVAYYYTMAVIPPHSLNPKGVNLSLWMSRNINNADSYEPLRGSPEQNFDVIIVGAGITGLSAALNLKRAGKKVAVLEHHTIGSGTTGNSTGHISLSLDSGFHRIENNFGKDKAALVYRGQVEARAEIERNCTDLEIAGYEGNVDAYLYAEAGQNQQAVRDEYVALNRTGADVQLLQHKSDIGLPFDAELAIKLPGSAQFDCFRYCQALARAVHGGGCVVHERTRVVGVKDGVPCEVKTEFTTLHAPNVICATHTPLGISVLQTAMIPYLSFAVAVRVEQAMPGGLFYDTHEPYHYTRRLDSANPHILIIGGADKKTGGTDRTETECFAELRRYVASRFTVQEELAHWCSQYYQSADGLPYVGTDPGSSHVWVATGFNGDGLSLGVMAATIITASILGDTHPLASVYSSHRFKPIASVKQVLAEGMSVAKHLILDRFTMKVSSLEGLRPGEGRVMKVDGHNVAAYREPDGRLHAHAAECTHLKWNDSEKTFDCPCHGSRFGVCGTVLEGPALRDLEDLIKEVPMRPAVALSAPLPSRSSPRDSYPTQS